MALQKIANLRGPRGPKGDPGVAVEVTDPVIQAAAEAKAAEVAESYVDERVAGEMANPETALNAAATGLMQGTMDAGAPGLVRVVRESLTNLAAPRPIWRGVINWLVQNAGSVPINMIDGDLRTVVVQEDQPWSPAQMPVLHAWYSAAATPAGDVQLVTDLSGRGRHMARHSGTVSVDAEGLNGRPGIALDQGTLRTVFPSPIIDGTVCFWWTSEIRDHSITSYIFYGDGTEDPGRISAFRQGSAQGNRFGAYWGTTAGQSLSLSSDASAHAFLFIAKRAGECELWIDNVRVATSTGVGTQHLANLMLGDRTQLDRPMQGSIGEFFISAGTPTTAERTAGMAYLAATAGVSW